MSEQKSQDNENPSDLGRLLAIGNTVLLALTFFVAMISMVAVLALRSDVAAIEEQMRKAAKSSKSLQEEIAALRESSEPVKTRPAAGTSVVQKPTHIDAADTSQDCVIRPGDAKSLSNCIGAATPGR